MRLLLDQGLPRLAVIELGRVGFDAVHTGDIGMATATDHEILAHAQRDGRTVVTLDADFHAILYSPTPRIRKVYAFESKACAPNRWLRYWRR